jgi:sortase B
MDFSFITCKYAAALKDILFGKKEVALIMNRILTIILSVAAFVCGCIAIYGYVMEQNAGRTYTALEKKVIKTKEDTTLSEDTSLSEEDAGMQEAAGSSAEVNAGPFSKEAHEGTESEELTVDFSELRRIAPDAYAWLQVPGTPISYPVCQHPSDNKFYLTHTAEQKEKFEGAVFSEKMNRKDFNDPMTVLYGHNMKNGSMFAALHNFSDRTFFDSHPSILIYTPGKTLKYRIFAAYERDAAHLLKTYNFKNAAVFGKYVHDVRSMKSSQVNINPSVSVDKNDRVVTLSTCTGNDNMRYLVQAVLEK